MFDLSLKDGGNLDEPYTSCLDKSDIIQHTDKDIEDYYSYDYYGYGGELNDTVNETRCGEKYTYK